MRHYITALFFGVSLVLTNFAVFAAGGDTNKTQESNRQTNSSIQAGDDYILFAATNNHVYRENPDGSWTGITYNTEFNTLLSVTTTTTSGAVSTLYTSSYNSSYNKSYGVWQTTAGETQGKLTQVGQPADLPYKIHSLIAVTNTGNITTLYAGTSGVCKYVLGESESWSCPENALTDIWVYSLLAVTNSNNTTTLYAGTDMGVYASVDDAESWKAVGAPVGRQWEFGDEIDSLLEGDNTTTFYAGTYGFGTAMFKTTDKNTWGTLGFYTDLKPEYMIQALLAVKNSDGTTTLYAGNSRGGAAPDYGVFCSNNAARNWVPCSDGLEGRAVLSLLKVTNSDNTTVLYAGTDNGVYIGKITGDTSVSWNEINKFPNDDHTVYALLAVKASTLETKK